MEKLSNKRQIHFMTVLFMFTYFISYITRINFGAIISEVTTATQIPKDILSIALTGSFITYGAGQVVSGIIGDRFSPKRLVQYGFIATILMNILLPLCSNPYLMIVVWCINGFAQSFMWPPLIKLMIELFPGKYYQNASVKVSWGSSFGTIAVYLLSPVLIHFFNWKAVFFFSAGCGIIMLILWSKACPNITLAPFKRKAEATNEEKKNNAKIFTPLFIFIMIAIVLQGMLRDGVTTWMPSLISETYHLSTKISILTGVILPIFSILCFQLASILYRKVFRNPITCAAVIFGSGALFSLLLILVFNKYVTLSIIFMALLTGCMHGVNLMLICMVPAYYQKQGNVGTVSGVLNSCTYIGSAISTYGIAVLSERFGWNFTLKIWLLIAVLGTIISFITIRPWKKKMQND